MLKTYAWRTLVALLLFATILLACITAPQLSPLPNTFAAVRARLDQLILNETDGALHAFLAFAGSGERNPSSVTGTDYLSVSPECKMSATIDLTTDASTTIYNGPALLCNVWLSTTVGTEAATIDDSTTARITLPPSLPVGSHQFNGARFDTNLTLNPGTNSTGIIMLEYRPMDSGVNY